MKKLSLILTLCLLVTVFSPFSAVYADEVVDSATPVIDAAEPTAASDTEGTKTESEGELPVIAAEYDYGSI